MLSALLVFTLWLGFAGTDPCADLLELDNPGAGGVSGSYTMFKPSY